MTNKELCLALMKSETELEVIELLKSQGYWDNSKVWRLYGDDPSNFSSAGNQADISTAALVEKITNSRDAILMNQCFLFGIDPKSKNAPKSITEAVAQFFDKKIKGSLSGQIKEWTKTQRREVAENLAVYLTGQKSKLGYPCINIADKGEGQTPHRISETILSLGAKNKKEIPFVHGKWNMGGTAALVYCGERNMQLVVSRRNPDILKSNQTTDNRDHNWGFTIVRREDPAGINDTSVFKYLAPLNSENRPCHGEILDFESDTMPIFPEMDIPYSKNVKWGTLIKLYEFQTRYNQMIGGKKGSLLRPLDLLAPDLGFPFRLHECRYGGDRPEQRVHQVNGLITRLHNNDVVEDDFPTYENVAINRGGEIERLTFVVYALKEDKASSLYRDAEKGILFSLNGQSQGWKSDYYFSRTRVGKGFLRKSLIVIVVCDELTERGQEVLFVNDRVHIREEGPFWESIDSKLTEYLSKHDGLNKLQEERQRQLAENKLDDSKPLESVLSNAFKNSPVLSKIFLKGERLSNAFRSKSVGVEDKKYEGKRFPTYFKHTKVDYGKTYFRDCPLNQHARLFFETDVVNEYFNRKQSRGAYELLINKNDTWSDVLVHGFERTLNLYNGKGTLNIIFPDDVSVGNKFRFRLIVSDETRVSDVNLAFTNEFEITITKEQLSPPSKPGPRVKPPSGQKGEKRNLPAGVSFPKIYKVFEEDYSKHDFTKYSGVRIVKKSDPKTGDVEFVFYVNMDNFYLQHEIKSSPKDEKLLKGQFEYGMALLGISLIYDHNENKTEEERYEGIEDEISIFSRALAPILIPMISEFSKLDLKSELIDQLSS